jgi:hypothetical protein
VSSKINSAAGHPSICRCPDRCARSPPASFLMFRGFLEPQTADGHSKGWKH